MIYLDFEKPLQELDKEIQQLSDINSKGKVNLNDKIEQLKKEYHSKLQELYQHLTPWQRVQVSRHPDRPYTLAYIDYISNKTFCELHGDRTVGDDKAMVGGLGAGLLQLRLDLAGQFRSRCFGESDFGNEFRLCLAIGLESRLREGQISGDVKGDGFPGRVVVLTELAIEIAGTQIAVRHQRGAAIGQGLLFEHNQHGQVGVRVAVGVAGGKVVSAFSGQ